MILGITGTLGAGKTTIVSYLEKQGFKHHSVRQFLIEEIKRRDMPIDRDSMVTVANDLRKKNSPSYILEQLYDQAIRHGGDAIIESIRAPGEVDALKGKDQFFLISIDADVKVRFKRIRSRGSETDDVSFERFVQNEQREMKSSDPAEQNLSYCMQHADFVIRNQGSLKDLYYDIDKTIRMIRSQTEDN